MSYTINSAGIVEIDTFLRLHGKAGLKIGAFLNAAERAANEGGSIIIELGAQYSDDGRPHTTQLELRFFDLVDDGEDALAAAGDV